MRLSVQSFQRKFGKNNEYTNDVNEFCESLIQQIDILSNISTAFSVLTNMPAKNDELFDIIPVVRRTLDIFNSKHITFICTEKELPILFDKDQLGRVVTNLVKNAIQATESEENPRIVVSLLKRNNHIELSVSDNGMGICESNKEKIFEPKFTTKSGGSGLGLAMVKSIISSYNGTITLKSKEGKGTIFTVLLNA